MRFVVFLILLIQCSTLNAQDQLKEYFDKAMIAKEVGDNIGYLTAILKADSLRPNHQLIQYYVGSAFARLGDEASSVEYLRNSVVSKGDIDLLSTDFDKIRASEAFKDLVILQLDIMAEVDNSEPAFAITEKEFHAEGLAYDPNLKRYFVGSVHESRIVEIDENSGAIKPFSDENDGLWSVFGMSVDSVRNLLWVATTSSKYMNNYENTLAGKAAVLKYNLADKSVQKYILTDGLFHWFGDLTLDSQGNLYVSDSETNNIYTIDTAGENLVLFYTDKDVRSLQGLAVSNDDRYLFYADYSNGISRLDLQTMEKITLTADIDISLKSVDGLYYFNNTLVVTQNLVVPMRVSQIILSGDQDRIQGINYLEKNNPVLNEPTLGVINNGWFYYVANSQWGAYNTDGSVNLDQLEDIQILKANINAN